jgi:hypothetical protein
MLMTPFRLHIIDVSDLSVYNMHSLVLRETLQKSTFAMPWCNDGGAAEINDVMLLRHDAHVHVPPMGASSPV